MGTTILISNASIQNHPAMKEKEKMPKAPNEVVQTLGESGYVGLVESLFGPLRATPLSLGSSNAGRLTRSWSRGSKGLRN